jgi:hypothetical protein
MENKKYSKLKAAFEATQPQAPADFTERVMKRIEEQPPVFQSKRRWVWLYPTIAAAIALLLYIGVNPNDQQPEHPILIVQTDTAQAVPQTKVETVDSVKVVKEMLQISRPPKHYMAKQEKQTEKIVEQEAVDATYLAEQAIAEEEQRMAMQMMQQMSGSLQDDYVKMTKEIRERGNSMTQQVTIAMSNEE